jgi:GNAT superfamily N-acetyltransferase
VILDRYGLVSTIRDAQRPDQAALSDLHRRSSWIWVEDRPALEAHPDALGVALGSIVEGRVRIAVGSAGELLGFSIVIDRTGVCELDDLFVEPRAMRRGVGSALVEDAATRASARGCRRMSVIAHPRTFPFYESVGFVARESAPTRFGPAVRMWRVLQRADR